MTRKMIGFAAFIITCYGFLIENVVRYENIPGIAVTAIIAVLAGIGFKGHFEDLKG